MHNSLHSHASDLLTQYVAWMETNGSNSNKSCLSLRCVALLLWKRSFTCSLHVQLHMFEFLSQYLKYLLWQTYVHVHPWYSYTVIYQGVITCTRTCTCTCMCHSFLMSNSFQETKKCDFYRVSLRITEWLILLKILASGCHDHLRFDLGIRIKFQERPN